MTKDLFNIQKIIKLFLIMLFSILVGIFFESLLNTSTNSEELPVVIVDLDESNESIELCETLKRKTNLTITDNENKAIDKLASGQVHLVMIIEQGYYKQIKGGSLTDLFTIYTGYNPKYSKLLLEIVSEEVLKKWVAFKLTKESEEYIEVDFDNLNNLQINDIIEVREEVLDNSKVNNIKSAKNNKRIIFIPILFLTTMIIILLEGYPIVKLKLNGVIKRVILFHPSGKWIYIKKIICEVIILYLLSSLIYGILLCSIGFKLLDVIGILFIYFIYIVIIKCSTVFIMYVANSVLIYNLFAFLFITINSIITGVIMFFKI